MIWIGRRLGVAPAVVMAIVIATTAASVAPFVPPVTVAAAQTEAGGEPTARLQTMESPGGVVTNHIRLEGWRPGSSVTVSICGNGARRGSQDCDLMGAKGVAIPPGGAASLAMRLQPPMPCPCVIRVVAANNDLLGAFPIELPGVPSAPIEEGATTVTGATRVEATTANVPWALVLVAVVAAVLVLVVALALVWRAGRRQGRLEAQRRPDGRRRRERRVNSG